MQPECWGSGWGGRGGVAWWKPPGSACQGNWFESCFWQTTWIEFLNQILFHYKTVIQIITLWGVVKGRGARASENLRRSVGSRENSVAFT